MRGLAVALSALIGAGCFDPTVTAGGACTDAGECPSPLVCDLATRICVEPGGADAAPCVGEPEVCDGVDQDCDLLIDEGFDVGAACVVGVGACAADGTQVCNSAQTGVDCMATTGGPEPEICGDAIDQDCDLDDPACPPNDEPGGAINISMGGTFTGELATAHDDASGSCGNAGGRDLFYQLTLSSTEVVYLDSVGSDFDVVIHVFDEPCSDLLGLAAACLDDECGAQAQGAAEAGPGTTCIVVDQGVGASETHGHVQLNVIRGRRPGIAITGIGSETGTTDGEANRSVPMCEGDSDQAPDVGYFFTVCPGDTVAVSADTCDNTPYDSWLSIREGSGRTGNELACLDDSGCGDDGDDSEVSSMITGPGLYWILVDGFADEAGPYRLDYSIQ